MNIKLLSENHTELGEIVTLFSKLTFELRCLVTKQSGLKNVTDLLTQTYNAILFVESTFPQSTIENDVRSCIYNNSENHTGLIAKLIRNVEQQINYYLEVVSSQKITVDEEIKNATGFSYDEIQGILAIINKCRKFPYISDSFSKLLSNWENAYYKINKYREITLDLHSIMSIESIDPKHTVFIRYEGSENNNTKLKLSIGYKIIDKNFIKINESLNVKPSPENNDNDKINSCSNEKITWYGYNIDQTYWGNEKQILQLDNLNIGISFVQPNKITFVVDGCPLNFFNIAVKSLTQNERKAKIYKADECAISILNFDSQDNNSENAAKDKIRANSEKLINILSECNIKSIESVYAPEDLLKLDSKIVLFIYKDIECITNEIRECIKKFTKENIKVFEWYVLESKVIEVIDESFIYHDETLNLNFTTPRNETVLFGVFSPDIVAEYIARTSLSDLNENTKTQLFDPENSKLCQLPLNTITDLNPIKRQTLWNNMRNQLVDECKNSQTKINLEVKSIELLRNRRIVFDNSKGDPNVELKDDGHGNMYLCFTNLLTEEYDESDPKIIVSTEEFAMDLNDKNEVIIYSGNVFNETVCSVIKSKTGELWLSIPKEINKQWLSNIQKNTSKLLDFDEHIQIYPIKKTDCKQQKSILDFISKLNSNPQINPVLSSITGYRPSIPTSVDEQKQWIVLKNAKIKQDEEQMSFLLTALNGENIELGWGPVGTGKSTVTAEIIYQYFISEQKAYSPILITSQTNAAVDGILVKLKNDYHLEVYRTGSEEKCHPELLDRLLRRDINNGNTAIRREQFLSGQIIIGGTMSSLSNSEVPKSWLSKSTPTKLFIDEFGVASTGEAISVMELATKKLFAIGDPMQLGLLPMKHKVMDALRDPNTENMNKRQIENLNKSLFKYIHEQKHFSHPMLRKVYRLAPKLVRLAEIHYSTNDSETVLDAVLKGDKRIDKDVDDASFILINTSEICREKIKGLDERKKDDKLSLIHI